MDVVVDEADPDASTGRRSPFALRCRSARRRAGARSRPWPPPHQRLGPPGRRAKWGAPACRRRCSPPTCAAGGPGGWRGPGPSPPDEPPPRSWRSISSTWSAADRLRALASSAVASPQASATTTTALVTKGGRAARAAARPSRVASTRPFLLVGRNDDHARGRWPSPWPPPEDIGLGRPAARLEISPGQQRRAQVVGDLAAVGLQGQAPAPALVRREVEADEVLALQVRGEAGGGRSRRARRPGRRRTERSSGPPGRWPRGRNGGPWSRGPRPLPRDRRARPRPPRGRLRGPRRSRRAARAGASRATRPRAPQAPGLAPSVGGAPRSTPGS